MLSIALCDDEAVIRRLLEQQIRSILEQNRISSTLTAYSNGKDLLEDLSRQSFHLFFLDIAMPRVSGFDLAETIRQSSPQSAIIFVTAREDLMHQSFDYQPFHFICKGDANQPFPDLERVLQKLLRRFKQDTLLTISDGQTGSRSVAIRDILYLQSEGHYLQYVLAGSAPPLLERGALRRRQEELEQYDFIRIHKQYLVNLAHIRYFDPACRTVTLSNGVQLPVSRKEKDQAKAKFMQFQRR